MSSLPGIEVPRTIQSRGSYIERHEIQTISWGNVFQGSTGVTETSAMRKLSDYVKDRLRLPKSELKWAQRSWIGKFLLRTTAFAGLLSGYLVAVSVLPNAVQSVFPESSTLSAHPLVCLDTDRSRGTCMDTGRDQNPGSSTQAVTTICPTKTWLFSDLPI